MAGLPEKKQHDTDEKEDAEEAAAVEDSESKAFEIAEFSERSASNSSGTADSDGSVENKEEGEGEGCATTPRSNNTGAEIEEDQPPSLDVAEAKGNAARSRAHAQPESKRGGRRDTARTGMFPLNRWVGRRQSHHEVGDLVEAEWAGSGWWYVGYVEREVPAIAGKQKKGFYHVVFADGDEADVDGRHLKQLGPSGHGNGSAGTLPRHVPIFDLRSGRLHRNLKEKKNVMPPFQGEGGVGVGGERGEGQKYRKERSQTKKQNNIKRSGRFGRSSSPRRGEANDDSPSGTQEGEDSNSNRGRGRGASMPRVAPLARRGSMGNVDDRRKQGQRAVWGNRRPPQSSNRGGGNGGGGGQEDDDADGGISNWWGTGTRYALQPRLSADMVTVTSFSPNGDGIARTAAAAAAAAAAGLGGDEEGIARASSRPTAASTARRGSDLRALSMLRQLQEQNLQEHQQQQLQQQHGEQMQQQQHDGCANGSYTTGGVMRVVQPAGENVDFGQRVFYLP